MTDEEIFLVIEALVEDNSLEELQDKSAMGAKMVNDMFIRPQYVLPILHAALQIKLLRQGNVPEWKKLLSLN